MRKQILAGLLVLMLLVTSFAGCAVPRKPPEKPEVKSITHRWGEVTSEAAEVLTTIIVYNPNPFILPVRKVFCDISLAGVKVGHGETQGVRMKAMGDFPINIATEIQAEKIPEFWAEHLRHGEVSEILLKGGVVFDLFITTFTFPFQLKRTLRTNLLSTLRITKPISFSPFGENIPFRLVIKSVSAEWGEVTKEKTELILSAVIYNDSPFTISIPEELLSKALHYEVLLNEIPLGIEGKLAESYRFLANSDTRVKVILTLDNTPMGKWFLSHIRNGERSIIKVKVHFVFDLPPEMAKVVGKNRLEIPLYQVEQEFETDLLGSKAK